MTRWQRRSRNLKVQIRAAVLRHWFDFSVQKRGVNKELSLRWNLTGLKKSVMSSNVRAGTAKRILNERGNREQMNATRYLGLFVNRWFTLSLCTRHVQRLIGSTIGATRGDKSQFRLPSEAKGIAVCKFDREENVRGRGHRIGYYQRTTRCSASADGTSAVYEFIAGIVALTLAYTELEGFSSRIARHTVLSKLPSKKSVISRILHT